MARQNPFIIGEWYHCYNRGVDKRIIFETPYDYQRFMLLLYFCNASERTHISNFKKRSFEEFLLDSSIERGEPLVEIGAYALMPNHFHLILQEIRPNGIAQFMHRVGTGYSMYFNIKNDRTGTLLPRPFKSKHIYDDAYLTLAVPYVLLNPAELFDPRWKRGSALLQKVKQGLLAYQYCSLQDFIGIQRTENCIAGTAIANYFERIPSFDEMLQSAQEYYQENASLFD